MGSVELNEAAERVIVALDGLKLAEALDLVKVVGPRAFTIKVHDLVDWNGPDVVRQLKVSGARRVWVDHKVIDTPLTALERVQALTAAGANFISVMADSEVDAMGDAVQGRADYFFEAADAGSLDVSVAAADGTGGSGIVAVTVLTSLGEEQAHLLYGQPTRAAVLYRVRLAKLAGVKHVVCSPRELGMLAERRELAGMDSFVTGIRSAGEEPRDHKWFDTPTAAIKAGKDRVRLVVGSSITEADTRVGAFFGICQEIASALAGRKER